MVEGFLTIKTSLGLTVINAPKLRISTEPSSRSCGCNKRSRAKATLRVNIAFSPLTAALPQAMMPSQLSPGGNIDKRCMSAMILGLLNPIFIF